MEDIFGDFFAAETTEPEQIKFSRKISKRLKSMGIRNICITDYNESLGPHRKFYMTKKSPLYRQLIENPAFLADILILAKDTREMLLRDERSLLLFRPIDRKCLKLVIIETTKEFRDEAMELAEKLATELEQRGITRDVIVELFENILME